MQVNAGTEYNLPEFLQVSPIVVDLIKAMLATDPDKRPTTAAILMNPWVMGGIATVLLLVFFPLRFVLNSLSRLGVIGAGLADYTPHSNYLVGNIYGAMPHFFFS